MTFKRKYAMLLLLGFCSASVYLLVYIRYYYYDAWLAALDVSNTKAGLLYSTYALGCTLSYLPGGLLADRLSLKKNFIVALILTAGLNFLFAFSQNYYLAVFIWFSLALTTGFIFWAGLVKAVRLNGSPDEQGKMFGFWISFEGLCSSVILAIALWVFSRLGEGGVGLRGAVVVQGCFCLLAALMVWLFFLDPPRQDTTADHDECFRLSALWPILKDSKVWLVAVVIFCTYNLFNSLSYMTPYLTAAFGLSETSSGQLALIRIQFCAFLLGPFGGIVADKLRSPAKLIFGGHLVMIVFLTMLIWLPVTSGTSFMAIAVTFLMSATIYTFYPIMYAVVEEMGFLRMITGTVVGVVTAVGYSPDLFFSPVYGLLLDNYGVGGYKYLFMIMVANSLVGSLAAMMIFRRSRSRRPASLSDPELIG